VARWRVLCYRQWIALEEEGGQGRARATAMNSHGLRSCTHRRANQPSCLQAYGDFTRAIIEKAPPSYGEAIQQLESRYGKVCPVLGACPCGCRGIPSPHPAAAAIAPHMGSAQVGAEGRV
jgi:hypothetical protein